MHLTHLQRRGRKTLSAAIALAVVASAGIYTASTASAATDLCSAKTNAVYQAVKPSNQASLVTTWKTEIDKASSTYGFTEDKGIPFHAFREPAEGLIPVERLFNSTSGDFVWIANKTEADTAVTRYGYGGRQTDFYASNRALSCTQPIYRFQKGGMHRLAVQADVAGLTAADWNNEGIHFHAFNAKTTTTTTARTVTSTTATPTTATPTTTRPTTTLPPALPDRDADGKFSLAIYPDTQMEVMSSTDQRLGHRGTYVGQQCEARDIRYVLHTGDVVNWDTDTPENPNDHRQYDYASREMAKLEATGIPWAAAIGNHDTHAVGPTGGSARPGTDASVEVRDTRTFNSYFPPARFNNISGMYESGKVDNAYRLFDAAGKKWMILNLELWPRQGAIDWAKGVVSAHPNHNVIVITHAYLNSNGSISTSNGGYGATSPQHLYNSLISQYSNIKFVFSGHVNTEAVRTDTGVNGNKIVSILTSFHSATTNEVRFLEIDTKNGSFSTDIYAPFTSKSYPEYTRSGSGMTWVG